MGMLRSGSSVWSGPAGSCPRERAGDVSLPRSCGRSILLNQPNHQHTASEAEWHNVTLLIANSRRHTLLQQELEMPKHNLALTRSSKRVAIILERID